MALNSTGKIVQFHETTKFFPGRIFDNTGEIEGRQQIKWFGSAETDRFLNANHGQSRRKFLPECFMLLSQPSVARHSPGMVADGSFLSFRPNDSKKTKGG